MVFFSKASFFIIFDHDDLLMIAKQSCGRGVETRLRSAWRMDVSRSWGLSYLFYFNKNVTSRLRWRPVSDSRDAMLTKSPKTPKTQNPIFQKRSILALFRLPYIGQYVRFSAMELKWSFLRGPAHKIEKRPFFAKKRKIEEQQKGFEVATCFAIIISSPTRASDPPRA